MPKLTLSMIVRNEEKQIGECLSSVKNVADEIVIVDTGSTDSTIEIAKSFDAKIFNYEWNDDFSAARNFALQNSTGDYLLYLDADERLDEHSIPEIKRITASGQKAAYYCTVKSYDTEGGRDHSMRYTRLFANVQGASFTGKVHEQIIPSLLSLGIKPVQTKILIHHFGYDVSADGKTAKAKRNLRLLLEESRRNRSPYIAFQLGQTFDILSDEENAVKYFKIAAQSDKLEKQHRAYCFTSLALNSHRNQRILEAENYISHSIKIDDRQPFAYLLASKISLRKGELSSAEDRCKKGFFLNRDLSAEDYNMSLAVILNPEEIIYFGLLLALQNKNNMNTQFYQRELFSHYQDRRYQNVELRKKVIHKLLTDSMPEPEEIEIIADMFNQASADFFVFALENNPSKEQIAIIAEVLLKKNPGSIELRKLNARILDETGKVEEAAAEMEKIISEDGSDPASFFYLVSFYLKLGRIDKLKPVVLTLEKNFSNIPDIMARIAILKKSLAQLSASPQQ